MLDSGRRLHIYGKEKPKKTPGSQPPSMPGPNLVSTQHAVSAPRLSSNLN